MEERIKLFNGDNMVSLKKLPDNFVDSIVTDPPYGLFFMNKKWDYDVPSVEFWKEVYRVLKPGGHVLSFGGTRTYHRMVVNMEDAGFEIRDQIMWVYASGFPKSHNIGKAVDKIQGNTPYEGWGTGLKPANEPICLARKPLSEKTIAENVLKWGTGGINIDDCRVGTDTIKSVYGGFTNALVDGRDEDTRKEWIENSKKENGQFNTNENEGRFPANFIIDEDASKLLDEQSGASRFFYIPKVSKKERNMGLDNFEDKVLKSNQINVDKINGREVSNPKESIVKNTHPTLKPINLMTYLCRLITPKGGVILDPYMGSGSTGISALLEGFEFIGMEMDEDYFKIAEARINNYELYKELIKKK